jgi:hypothetical protein
MLKPGSLDGAAGSEVAKTGEPGFTGDGVMPAAGGAFDLADEMARVEVTMEGVACDGT